jgi:hypothetical protein
MKIIYYLLIISCYSFSFVLIAADKTKTTQFYSNKIDKNVEWIFINHPKNLEIIKKMGKPQLEEKDSIYYALNDFKYSLSIKFKNGILSFISYELPPESQMSIHDFAKDHDAKEFTLYPETGHEKGRLLRLYLPKEKLALLFKNNSEKKLTTMIYEN